MLLKYETIVSLSESVPKICEKKYKNQSFQEWISNDLFSHIKLEELFVKLCFERQPAITPFLRHFQIWGILFSTGFPGWETKNCLQALQLPSARLQCPTESASLLSPPSVGVKYCSVRWDTWTSQLANKAKSCLEEFLYYSSRQIFFSSFFALVRVWNQTWWLRNSAVEASMILCSLSSDDIAYSSGHIQICNWHCTLWWIFPLFTEP